MVKEVLTHSDRYVRKTNHIILIVGIITLCLFVFGLLLLAADEPVEEQKYEVESTIDAETDIGIAPETSSETEIEFGEAETEEKPITLTPNPINMGQVLLGNEASNVLTIGTNGKFAIRIVSVELEDAPFEGFSFKTDCNDKELRGKITCSVLMNWVPTMAENVQNNFKVIWHETRLSERDAKHDEVSVFGSAVTKENCNFCDSGNGTLGIADTNLSDTSNVRYAVGPDGKIIGIIGDDGIVRDFSGNEIGKVTADGLIVDRDGNVIGVASTGRMIMDENGNVIGYVDANGVAYDVDGNVIGNVLADGTVVDANGNVIGKALDYGYVYDDNGNIIGRVLPDGSVVDLDGNVIGRMNENGEVVDFNGNTIGRVAKSGEVMFDENGNPIGIVMPDGSIVNENGDIVGRVDKNGNAIAAQKIGKRGPNVQLAVDKDGNIIGYVDENGVVRDFNGNIIGHVDENGNIIDENGNIIGHVSNEWADLALDENGNVIGYIGKDGLVHRDGKIIGYVNDKGEIIGNNGDMKNNRLC
jgi:YD repeat-containing protein